MMNPQTLTRILTALLSLLAFSGCRDSIFTVYPQGDRQASNGRIVSGVKVAIRGKRFGEVPGQVRIGGVRVPIDVTRSGYILWKNREIVIRIPDGLVSGSIQIETADGRIIRGPELLLDQGPRDVDAVYQRHINDYAARNDLDQNWVRWMLDQQPQDYIDNTSSNRDRGLLTFTTQRLERKTITVAYTYYEGRPYRMREPWPVPQAAQELAHMGALKNMMEAAFPGYRFTFFFDADPMTCDLAVQANHPNKNHLFTTYIQPEGDRSGGVVRLIQSTNDGVLIHEIGHYLGLSHHYEERDASDIGEGKRMPPGSRTCRMDRTAGWCTACLAALDIDPDAYQEERVAQAIQILYDHYDR